MACLGAHVSASGGLPRAFARAREMKADCLQIFTRAPSRWRGREIPGDEAEAFRVERRAAKNPPVLAHDLYLTNLAAADAEIRQRSIDSVVEELGRCHQLGLDALVCHLGSHADEQEGLFLLAQSLGVVLARSQESPVPLWLETTAGQGTCLGHRFAHIGHCLAANFHHPRLGVCLDTCHVYAAGYDLSTETGYAAMWEEFAQEIGMDRLRAFHLNDSQKVLGSRVDRHAHIGQGEIGQAGFARLVCDARFQGLPMIIETPESETMHAANLSLLKRLQRAGRRRTRTRS